MDKQIGEVNEMVEEMAKGMCEHCIENEEFTCSIAPQPCVFAKTFAENLYNAGYRKIPENAVVVPDMAGKDFYTIEKAEWDKMVQGAKDIIHEREEKTRKETAERFAEKLRNIYTGYIDEDEISVGGLRFWIAEICKDITEGKV
jgi:hypothetical protein